MKGKAKIEAAWDSLTDEQRQAIYRRAIVWLLDCAPISPWAPVVIGAAADDELREPQPVDVILAAEQGRGRPAISRGRWARFWRQTVYVGEGPDELVFYRPSALVLPLVEVHGRYDAARFPRMAGLGRALLNLMTAGYGAFVFCMMGSLIVTLASIAWLRRVDALDLAILAYWVWAPAYVVAMLRRQRRRQAIRLV